MVRSGSYVEEACDERGHRWRACGKADAVTAPLSGVAGPVVACGGRG